MIPEHLLIMLLCCTHFFFILHLILMKPEVRIFKSKIAAFTVGVGSTKGFVQLGLDVEAISSSAYPSFSFGGRNSAGH